MLLAGSDESPVDERNAQKLIQDACTVWRRRLNRVRTAALCDRHHSCLIPRCEHGTGCSPRHHFRWDPPTDATEWSRSCTHPQAGMCPQGIRYPQVEHRRPPTPSPTLHPWQSTPLPATQVIPQAPLPHPKVIPQAPLPPKVIPQAPLPAPPHFESSSPPDYIPAPSRVASLVFCRRSTCAGNRRRWIGVGPSRCGDPTPCSVTVRPRTCAVGRPSRPLSMQPSLAVPDCDRHRGFGCTVAHSIPGSSTRSSLCPAPRPPRRCSIAWRYSPAKRPSC